MKSRNHLRIALLALIAIAVATPCPALAAMHNKKLDVGSAAPNWKNLPGIDGKNHSLADYKDAKLLVVIFTCNRCPVAVAYQDRIIQLQKDFSPKGVQIVAINCNTDSEDALPAMKERAAEKSFNFPYLYDESQQSGRDYGATVTPHVFVLDAARKVAYMGSVDDNIDGDRAKHHYLSDALSALLAGKAPPQTESRQFGCGIAYQ